MAESWRTSDDGSRNGKSPRDRFAHPMSARFFNSICPAVIATHPWSAIFPFVAVRFMVFWTSYGESDGFRIRPKESLV
jgi:hypothetical protein